MFTLAICGAVAATDKTNETVTTDSSSNSSAMPQPSDHVTQDITQLADPANFQSGSAIYVNGVTGDDAWDGEAPVWDGVHGPKKTINAGIDVVDTGGTVYVAAGTYNESVIIMRKTNLEATGTVNITGSGSGNGVEFPFTYGVLWRADGGMRLQYIWVGLWHLYPNWIPHDHWKHH